MDIVHLLEECKKLQASGETSEGIVASLRRMGADKIYSALVLRELYAIGFREALKTVHLSQTWKDMRKSDEEFDEMVDKAFQTLAQRSRGAIRF